MTRKIKSPILFPTGFIAYSRFNGITPPKWIMTETAKKWLKKWEILPSEHKTIYAHFENGLSSDELRSNKLEFTFYSRLIANDFSPTEFFVPYGFKTEKSERYGNKYFSKDYQNVYVIPEHRK